MRVVCAWCEREGRPALLREEPPLDVTTVTHGICDRHTAAVLGALGPSREPGEPRPSGADRPTLYEPTAADLVTAERQIPELLRTRPEIGFCAQCLAAVVGLPVQTVALLTARLAESGRCEQALWWCPVCSRKTLVTLRVTRPARPEAAPGPRVLIVDDDPDSITILTSYLAHRGYRPEAATQGREALTLISHERPDIVLLDVWMPEIDGLRVLQHVRAAAPTLPVIMVTANSDARAVKKAKRLGAVDYLVKPVDLGSLALRMAAALDRARRSRRRRGPLA